MARRRSPPRQSLVFIPEQSPLLTPFFTRGQPVPLLNQMNATDTIAEKYNPQTTLRYMTGWGW